MTVPNNPHRFESGREMCTPSEVVGIDRFAVYWRLLSLRLPLICFVGAYLFSCYVGALAMLGSVRFRTLYFIFSGVELMPLTRRDLFVVLALLHAGPLALWAGYEAVVRFRFRTHSWSSLADRLTVPLWAARVAFLIALGFGGWALDRAGGVQANLFAWFDYNAYVVARWRMFDALGFLDFVNLYTVLPVTAAVLLLRERYRTFGIVAMCFVLLIQYPLAIRKVLLTSVAIFGFAVYIYCLFGTIPRRVLRPRSHVVLLLGGPLALYGLYTALTLMTVLSPDARPFRTIASLVPGDQVARAKALRRWDESQALHGRGWSSLAVDARTTDANISAVLAHRTTAVLLYTLLSPLTRTSVCSVVYPVIFPRWHPFYPIDVGLDVLGIGRMPDDNLVVYRFLWPSHHRGSVAAPFHIVLYSQGGTLIALVGSLLVGALLGLLWLPLLASDRPQVLTSVWGGLVLTLGVFLAIDSVRNSLLVSYGLGWGLSALVVMTVCGRLLAVRPFGTPVTVQ